jgi:anhydro-N-acetylmuramic acid kinase
MGSQPQIVILRADRGFPWIPFPSLLVNHDCVLYHRTAVMRRRITANPCFLVGLMSGTSADGIEAVVAQLCSSGRHLEASLVAHVHRPFPVKLHRRILRASMRGTAAEICELNFTLGEDFARAALAAIRKARLEPRHIVGIGSHGQTIHHLPNSKPPSSLQIGEAAVIAERTGITTVADFRVRDLAAGGQGAPLVAFADWALFTHKTKPRIVQNIGGIANLTYLPPGAQLGEVRAFDTGPGNIIIDAVVLQLSQGRRSFDHEGRWANRGRVCGELLVNLRSHPFLRRSPPKTTGREEFGEGFARQVLRTAKRLDLPDEDIVATVTAFTAASIAEAYRRFIFPGIEPAELSRLEIILSGGGAKNLTLRRMLGERLESGTFLTQQELGFNSDAKEALAFAILAYHTLLGKPSNVPSATGARRPVVLGKIVPGRRSFSRSLTKDRSMEDYKRK